MNNLAVLSAAEPVLSLLGLLTTFVGLLILVPSAALLCAPAGKGGRALGVSVLLVVALAIGGYIRYWP